MNLLFFIIFKIEILSNNARDRIPFLFSSKNEASKFSEKKLRFLSMQDCHKLNE